MRLWVYYIYDKIEETETVSRLKKGIGYEKRSIIGIFAIAAGAMLAACGLGTTARTQPVEVNRTYEKIDPSPAVEAPSYDLNLKIDTENDRITEVVRIDIQNNTDVSVDSVYLRYYPMGYFGYLCEARPDVAEANKDKKAEITAIRFDGTDKDLSAEYFMDEDTFETQGVTIRSYYLKAGKPEAYREITKQVIKDGFEFFTELLGRYPRAEYTMIQGVDGMEHSGLAFVDGKTFLNSEDEIMNKLQRNIVHEVGHSWFYDAVGNNEYRELDR